MNRIAWWRLVIMGLALAFGLFYSMPNLFGESPAVQVSTARATLKVEPRVAEQVEAALEAAGIPQKGVVWEANNTGNTVRARFDDTDLQLKAKDAIEKALNGGLPNGPYVVALNLVSASPQWLTSLHALPMYLGAGSARGVHFSARSGHEAALASGLMQLPARPEPSCETSAFAQRHQSQWRDGGHPLSG